MNSSHALFSQMSRLFARIAKSLRSSESGKSDVGIAFVFVALFLPLLIMAIVMVLEVSTLRWYQRSFKYLADRATVEALIAYTGDTSCTTEPCRRGVAQQRLETVLSSTSFPRSSVDMNEVQVSFGRIVVCQDNSNNVAACDIAAEIGSDRILVVDVDQSAAISAMRVDFALEYQGWFLRLLSTLTNLDIPIVSTAATTPRIYQLLFDVSGTTTDLTHPGYRPQQDNPLLPQCGLGFQFAYPVQNTTAIGDEWDEWATGQVAMPPDRLFPEQRYLLAWNHTRSQGRRSEWDPSLPQDPSYFCEQQTGVDYPHFWDDYRGLNTLSDFEFDSFRTWYEDNGRYSGFEFPHPNPSSALPPADFSAAGGYFLVDSFFGSGLRPEPLGSIFEGARSLVETFSEQQVVGDRIGVTAVRGDPAALPWTSTIRPTGNFDYIADILTPWESTSSYLFGGETPWQVGGSVTVNNALTEGMQLPLRLGFFPGRPTETDFLLPLQDTLDVFSAMRAAGIQGNYGIIFFTDNMPNCPRECGAKQFLGGSIPEDPQCVTICNNTYENFIHSAFEVSNLAWEGFAANEIPIHVFSFIPGTNTLAVQNPLEGNSCYSEREFRAAFSNQILKGHARRVGLDEDPRQAFSDFRSGSGPFFSADVFGYTMAAITGGEFFSLRPVAPGCTSGTECTSPGVTPLSIAPGGLFPRGDDQASLRSIQDAMVFSDPECRGVTTQIQDYIRQILGANPYVNLDVPRFIPS